jgi:hypothetical protein
MARQMVINYGMSNIGPWSLMDPSAQSGDMIMRMLSRNSMSENLQQRIDDNVRRGVCGGASVGRGSHSAQLRTTRAATPPRSSRPLSLPGLLHAAVCDESLPSPATAVAALSS